MRRARQVAFLLLTTKLLCASTMAQQTNVENTATPAVTLDQLESDWLKQAQLRYGDAAAGKVTTAQDAAGGCDGVINGKWGFHTALEENPWWQVDLGSNVKLSALKIYNRCDGGFPSRASRIKVLLSNDSKQFELAYSNDGTVFRGHPDKKPPLCSLEVSPDHWPPYTPRASNSATASPLNLSIVPSWPAMIRSHAPYQLPKALAMS